MIKLTDEMIELAKAYLLTFFRDYVDDVNDVKISVDKVPYGHDHVAHILASYIDGELALVASCLAAIHLNNQLVLPVPREGFTTNDLVDFLKIRIDNAFEFDQSCINKGVCDLSFGFDITKGMTMDEVNIIRKHMLG